MEQHTGSPRTLRVAVDRHTTPIAKRYTPYSPTELPSQPECHTLQVARPGVRRRAVRQVMVLEVAGRLDDMVGELDLAIQLSLAHGPRGVICDLSASPDPAGPVAVEMLASAGRHARHWPGIPVAVVCPDLAVREALSAHRLGRNLIVTESLSTALTAVLATPYLIMQCLTLAAHPTAPRAARNFVTRTLLDWKLDQITPNVCRVVSELVASSSVHSGSDIDLSVVWDRGFLRLTVRDRGPALPGQSRHPEIQKRGLTVISGLSLSCGVLPTDDGGEVVWAVFEAPRSPAGNSLGPSRPSPGKNDGNVKAT
jgi:hypothetical protein